MPLDLTQDRAARRARKRTLAVHVEFAGADGMLSTREGPMKYSTGDALLTDSEGERGRVARDAFDADYAPVAPTRVGKPGQYRKRPVVVWAKPFTDAPDVSPDHDHETVHRQHGDWLVQQAPSNFSVVSAFVFAQTYELLD